MTRGPTPGKADGAFRVPGRKSGLYIRKPIASVRFSYIHKHITTWHPLKREANARKHGVDLAIAEGFEWDAALVQEDATEAYGEQRFRAIGPIGDVLYVYVYTLNAEGTEDHAISLRRAEPKERCHYAREI